MKDAAKMTMALREIPEYLRGGGWVEAYDENTGEPDQHTGVIFNALIDWSRT